MYYIVCLTSILKQKMKNGLFSDKEDEKIPSKRKKQILTQKKVEKTEEKNKKPKTEEKESKPEIIIEKAQKLRSDQNGAKETVVKKQTQQKIDNARCVQNVLILYFFSC